MPIFEFTSPDGKTYEIEGPEGATQEQAWEILQQQRAQELSHPAYPASGDQQTRYELAQGLGLPTDQVDLGQGIPFLDRVQMGFQSDPFPPERQAFLEQTYPGAKIAQSGDTWAVLPPGAEAPMVTNPPGLEWGDVGQFGGETGPVIAGGGLGAAFGGIPGAVIGAGLASGAREGGQMLAGTQRESGKDVALRAVIEMGMETLPGLKQGYRALRDTIGKRTGREMAKVMENIKPDDLPALINELRERGTINLPDLMNFQKSDNEVLRALAFQVRQFSPTAQTRIVNQLDNIAKAAQDYVPDLGKGQSADALIQQRFKARMEGMRRDLAGEPVDVTQAGQATQGLVKGGIDARKSAMRSAYDEVDQLAALEKPVFDISGSQKALKETGVYGVGLPQDVAVTFDKLAGTPVGVAKVRELINVAKPSEKLARIDALLQRLDPVQTEYQVLKELRSQVGGLLEMPYAQRLESGLDIGRAKRLYGALSEDLAGATNAPKFSAKLKEASTKAKTYYDTYDQQQVGEVLSSIEGQTPVGVWNALAKNPASWERAFIDTIETAKDDPALLGRVKSNLERMILRSDDPVKTLGAWEKTNPDALKWLFPDKRSLSIAKQNARVLNEYATSAYAKAEDAGFEQTGFALEAIKDAASRKVGAGMTPAQNMRQLMLDGGRVSPELRNVYRNAVLTDIINSGLKNHPKYGTDAINPAALSKKIADMRKSGAYDAFLTQRDRQALSALQQFAKKSWKTGDSGSGLAVAAQLGRVRHGDIGALGNIWSSAKLARMITSTELPMQWVFSPTKQVGGVRQAYRSAMGSQASKEIFRAIRQGWLGQGLESQMLPTGEPSLPPELVNPLP